MEIRKPGQKQTGRESERVREEKGGSCRAREVSVSISTIVSLIAPIALNFGISVCFSPPVVSSFSLNLDYAFLAFRYA